MTRQTSATSRWWVRLKELLKEPASEPGDQCCISCCVLRYGWEPQRDEWVTSFVGQCSSCKAEGVAVWMPNF